MGASKVEYNGETLIDISNDTVTPDTLEQGKTAHNANGDPIIGRAIFNGGGGSGSGIIDVAELPTEGIDENAIYRITTQFEDPPLDLWVVMPDGVRSMRQMLGANAIIFTYMVRELPSDMIASDTSNKVFHLFVLDSTGVAYINVLGMGVITVGIMFAMMNGMGAMEELDKGWTDDPYSIDLSNPLNYGIYTTRPVYKTLVRLYSRKNSEWNEHTAHINYEGVPKMLSGEYSVGGTIEVKECQATVDVTPYIIENKSIPAVVVDAPNPAELIEKYVWDVHISKAFFIMDNKSVVTRIRDYAFAAIDELYTIELPAELIEIGMYAFYNCHNLALTELPSGIKSIGTYAFYNCRNIALTELPEGITVIEPYAFYTCHNLALTELPSGIKSIGTYAFYNCHNLALTELPEGITAIEAGAFCRANLSTVTRLPEGITAIEREGFRASDVGFTTLPASLTRIENEAFLASNVTFTKIPEQVTYIGQGAFSYCDGLVELEIQGALIEIGNYSFRYADNLTTVTIKGKLQGMFNGAIFNNCPNLTTLNVSWAPNEISGAPWGATNATINYNYTGDNQ